MRRYLTKWDRLTNEARGLSVAALRIAISMAGVITVCLISQHGIGTSPDSAVYIGAAHNLRNGLGFSVPFGDEINGALTRFPPFYPLMIAGVSAFGEDVQSAARMLQAGLFGINLFLLGTWLLSLYRESVLPALAGMLIGLFSPVMLKIHSMAWSEPLFIAFGFTGFLLLNTFIETRRGLHFFAATLFIAAALFTRYIGIVFVLAGALILLIRSNRERRKGFAYASFFGVLAVFPFLVLSLIQPQDAGTIGGREFVFNPIGWQHIREFLRTIASWFGVPGTATIEARFAIILALSIGLSVISIRSLSVKDQDDEFLWIRLPSAVLGLLIFVTLYFVFVFFSLAFFDANILLDDRILSPAYFASQILVVYSVSLGVAVLRQKRRRILTVLLLLCIAAVHIGGDSQPILRKAAFEGLGFSSVVWKNSGLLDQIEQFPEDTLIYSNAPEAIFLRAKRSSYRIPRVYQATKKVSNEDISLELLVLENRLEQSGGAIVYFDEVPGITMMDRSELANRLELESCQQTVEGVIFTLRNTEDAGIQCR